MVAILCPSGFEFFVNALAVWFCGRALLPIALGTNAEGCANLCQKTGASALLTHPSLSQLAQETVSLLVNGGHQKPHVITTLPKQKAFEQTVKSATDSAKEKHMHVHSSSSLIIFHSSGSTGLPKPIYHIHNFWCFSLASASGTDVSAYGTTPLYHGGMSDFLRSLQAGSTIFFHPITGHGNTLATESIRKAFAACSQSFERTIKPPGYFLSVPIVLEMLSKTSEGLQFLRRMELVSTGGAPLSQAVGDLLVREGVHIVSRLGSSECGFLMSSFRDFDHDTDWNWLRAQTKLEDKELLNFRESSDNPGLFELVVTGHWPTKLLSNSTDSCFETKDLYVRHPEHSDRYQYATRVDDTLVLLNGKKFAAGIIESRLRNSDLVEDAIVFGANHALVGAVVIPTEEVTDTESKYALVQSLRPFLNENLNPTLPPHARIPSELIVVSDPELARAIPRSSKGTLQRSQAYRQLSTVIDSVYRDYETGTLPGYPDKEALEGEDLRSYVFRLANKVLPRPVASVTEDLHQAGMDSIGATKLKAMINQRIALGSSNRLDGNVIYDYPTVEALVGLVKKMRAGKEATSKEPQPSTSRQQMQDTVHHLSADLPKIQTRSSKVTGAPVTVLTGATGGLGAELLCALLAASSDSKILCLVRADSDEAALKRVQASISDRELSTRIQASAWSSRIYCFASLLIDQETLGVASAHFMNLVQSTAKLEVVHAAWSVNFALSFQSFARDNLAALAHLLHFSMQHGAQAFLFCSSIASVLGNQSNDAVKTGSRVLEMASADPATAGSLGYSQSKWVAEAIVERAGLQGLRCAVARIGQLCSNSVTGVWNESEGWPLMVRTSRELKALPVLSDRLKLDWLPIDTAAKVLTEILCATAKGENSERKAIFYHVVLPVDVLASQNIPTWSDLLNWLAAGGLAFQKEELSRWLDDVQSNTSRVRGRALLNIWRNLPSGKAVKEAPIQPIVETSRARWASVALQQARPIDAKVIEKTIQHWTKTGFL